MPPIDDLLNSFLVAEIAAELGSTSSSDRKMIIPFEAIELAAETNFALESNATSLMNQLAIAKNWIIKVYFFERKVEIGK